MNHQEYDILSALFLKPNIDRHTLSELCGCPMEEISQCTRNLVREGYIDDNLRLTQNAKRKLKSRTPQNAIILAAGFGMRMVPINTEIPKGLLEINGEPLIERAIKQLHEVGIKEIYVAVGFMKEQFEYLVDKYGVQLIINLDYARKNNLHTLLPALPYLSNTYIIPCDIWCRYNPYRRSELYSWYMVSDLIDDESPVKVNSEMELVPIQASSGGNAMVGISYLLEEQAAIVRKRVEELCRDSRNDDAFWEKALYEKDRLIVQARVVPAADVVEINTFEQLRELDHASNQLKSDVLQIISKALNVEPDDITDIAVLKKGMTNRSFLFSAMDKKYIMRIPGEGTDQLVNRVQEAAVYRAIDGKRICDDVTYINPKNGYKITEFLEGSRVCNPRNEEDLRKCMAKLRHFHEMGLKVDHEFNIFTQIDFYENLWKGAPSAYKDYQRVKKNVFRLQNYINKHATKKVLTHIDAVPDNFLLTKDGDIRLIDWEYAGMQDPHVDIAMFCIYSLYNRQEVDQLINIYFANQCTDETRIKVYCYIAACGLLWSNWCEYKRSLGVEFGDYSIGQYKFAKDYYQIVEDELDKRGVKLDA